MLRNHQEQQQQQHQQQQHQEQLSPHQQRHNVNNSFHINNNNNSSLVPASTRAEEFQQQHHPLHNQQHHHILPQKRTLLTTAFQHSGPPGGDSHSSSNSNHHSSSSSSSNHHHYHPYHHPHKAVMSGSYNNNRQLSPSSSSSSSPSSSPLLLMQPSSPSPHVSPTPATTSPPPAIPPSPATTSISEVDEAINNCASMKSPHDALFLLTSLIKRSTTDESDLVKLLHHRALIFTHMNMLSEAERDVREIVTKLAPHHAPTWALISNVLQREKRCCVDLLLPQNVAISPDFYNYEFPHFDYSLNKPHHHHHHHQHTTPVLESDSQQQQQQSSSSSNNNNNNNNSNTVLNEVLQQDQNEGFTPDTQSEVPEELECSLCYRIFHQPITLPCGHSFDKVCLARVFDYTSKCPLCRLQIHILPSEIPVSVTLQTIVERYYAKDYKARLEESAKEDAIVLSSESDESNNVELPLFVLGDYVLYPGTKLGLHIFEPRYRLLMRRCMSGSRQFGLISTNGRTLSKYGTVAKILNLTQLDDGRSLVETVGGRRFSICSEPWQVDGYNVARVSFFRENPIPDSDRLVVDEMSRTLDGLLDSFFSEVGSEMRQAIEQKIGPLPPRENIVDRSFWLASLLPLRAENKLELLRIVDTKDRLAMLQGVMTELTSRQESGCLIQ